MSVRLGIVMDPIARINFKKDSSLAMLLAAQARGWSLFYMEQQDLYQKAGVARGRMRPLKVFNDASRWFELEAEAPAQHRHAVERRQAHDASPRCQTRSRVTVWYGGRSSS